MFEFHKDKKRYFDIQYQTSKEYVIPFVKPYLDWSKPLKILEIGCGEAGVLKAFTELGYECTGIELEEIRIDTAKEFMSSEFEVGKVHFIVKNIYDINPEKDLAHKFDLIILKDVIEHIHGQEVFISQVRNFLSSEGKIFFAFPPWYMPFGGHQQMCENKLLQYTPYYHLLPMSVYKGLMRLFGEEHHRIESLAEVKETGISIERFEKIVKQNNFTIFAQQHYLFNPIYKYKFNLTARKQFKMISAIPFLRNFVTTAVYYLIG